MSDFNSLVQYTVENISRPIKYIIYKLTEFIRVVDKFVFRQVPAGAASGYATIEQIEGNTVAWNQLVDTSSTSVVVQSGHVYYGKINGTASIATSDGTPISVTGGTDIIHDLTLIFGAGNEPTIVADFEAWMAQNGLPMVADYNAGELLSCKMSGVQTEDNSQQTLDTIALDVTTITGINTATNVREVIFADGMKQADREGTVKDETNCANGTATKKCWEENLAELSWQTRYVGDTNKTVSVTPEIRYKGNGVNVILSNYQHIGIVGGVSNLSYPDDKEVGLYTYYSTSNPGSYAWYLVIPKNSNPTGSAVYELKDYITYTDLQDANGNPLNPRYKVEQGGTEQVLPVNTSTPTTVAPILTTVYTKDNN